jgi:hypothetical protein
VGTGSEVQTFPLLSAVARVSAFLIDEIVLQIDSNDPLEQNLRHPKLELLINYLF